MITAISTHQIRSFRRQHMFVAALGIFLTMSALAGLLGWSSSRTIVRVYDEAVKILASTGKPAPPNPFLLKPPLSMFSNMVVYVPFLGALLALIVGHISISDDETQGVGRVLFSRRVTRTEYALGKIVASGEALAAILTAGFLVSLGSLLWVNGAMPVDEILRLALFYGLSWLYLMVFVLVGMATVLMTKRRSLALLSAMGSWLVITFVIPQFTSGVRPVASLNPIIDPVGTSQPLFQVSALLRPYSIVEQYKAASAQILGTATAEPLTQAIQRVYPIAGLIAVLTILTFVMVRRHDFSRIGSGE